MRNFWWSAILLICSYVYVQAEQSKPDVVLITIDTLRADHLGCYGYQSVTSPAIDRIASSSAVFEKAYATAPLTLPSHTSILTGVYPAIHGFRDNAFFGMLKVPSLPTILKGDGYHTAAFISGAPLNGKFGLHSGFDVYDDNFNGAERRANVTTDHAIRWWQNTTSPRFLWVHYFDPHSDYNPPSPFDEKFAKNLYDGEIAFVDQQLSRLTAAIGGSVLIITADHGESLGEHGESTHGVFLYNATLRVPFIIRAPGIATGKRKEAVTLCDVVPTILDLLKISVSTKFQGTSLMKTPPARTLFAESLYAMRNFGYSSLFAVIEQDRKYIQSPAPELYDLNADPQELKNEIAAANQGIWKSEIQNYTQMGSSIKSEEKLSAEELEKLRSLGYLAGNSAEKEINPKTKIAVIEKFNQAMILMKLEKYPEAEKQFRSLIESEPENSLGFRFLADSLAAQKNYEAAQEAYSQALKIRPDPEVSVQLAKAYSRTQQLDVAEQILRKTLTEFREYEDAKFELASLLASQNRYDEAFALLDQGKASYKNQKGILYLMKNDPAAAADEFEAALRVEVKPLYWNNAGIAYTRLKRIDDARKAYQKALAMDPEYSECEVNLALLFMEERQYSEAIQHLAPLINRNPELLQARLMLGYALENTGQTSRALNTYKDLLAVVPEDWAQKQQLLKRIEQLSKQL